MKLLTKGSYSPDVTQREVVSRVMRKIVYGSGRNLLQGELGPPWLHYSGQGAKGQGRRSRSSCP